jgi:oligoendopeptidase F
MDLRVLKPHQLSDEVEKFDLEKSVTANSNWGRLFDETHAALKYDFRGEQLSNAEVFDKFHSPDRSIRKDAADAVAKTLGNNIKLFTLITNTLAKDKSIEDKWRGFKKPISSRNIANLVEDEVVDALISTVKKNYSKISHRYYKWKAKQLGLDKMEYWDRNAPLTELDEEYIPYKRGVEITLEAYGKFSPKILETANKFFDNAWIDVPPQVGKDSGAFAHPCATSVHPYLMLNYQGKTRDVMTLAHELGHGIHQYLARAQGALMADTPLTLAETASVFGEQLVFRYMLEMEKDPAKKKIMIAKKVEDMINTLIRQIAFCEFERKVHDGRKFGELTPDDIGKFWLEVQTESLGDIFNFTNNGYETYWSYIPHFIHTPFYVYAYAFGDSLVNSLYGVYLSGLKDFENKYLELLATGGAKRHKELLAPFGLDASDFSFWQKGIDIIGDFITELEK